MRASGPPGAGSALAFGAGTAPQCSQMGLAPCLGEEREKAQVSTEQLCHQVEAPQGQVLPGRFTHTQRR